MIRHFLFFILLLSSLNLAAKERQLANQAYIGPESYWLERTRKGALGRTKQSGSLSGLRVGYDRLKRYGWYLGAEALWAQGGLSGKSAAGNRQISTLTDQSIEGRFGYTFQAKSCGFFSFTPFGGIGYFSEANNFRPPSPIPIHIKNTFSYIPFGFLSHIYFNDYLGMGIKFTTRYLYKHKVKTSHDPNLGKLSMRYSEKLQYRVEVPFTCDAGVWSCPLQISAGPFFEYRSYGYMANFPYDFLKTEFHLYGTNLKLVFLF